MYKTMGLQRLHGCLFGLAFQPQREVLLACQHGGFAHARRGNVVAVHAHYGAAPFVNVEHESLRFRRTLVENGVEYVYDKLHGCEVVVVDYDLVATRFAQVDIGAIAH